MYSLESLEAKYDNKDIAIFPCCSVMHINGRIPHYSAPTGVIIRNQLSGYTMVKDSCFNNDIGQVLKYNLFQIRQRVSGVFAPLTK